MEKDISFDLESIDSKQFAIIEDSYKEELEQVEIKVGINFGVDFENNSIGCRVEIKFLHDSAPFIISEVLTVFIIEKDSWDKLIENNQVTFSSGFLRHITSISIGGCRGILHEKTDSTKFNKFIFPLVNIKELITEDESFEL